MIHATRNLIYMKSTATGTWNTRPLTCMATTWAFRCMSFQRSSEDGLPKFTALNAEAAISVIQSRSKSKNDLTLICSTLDLHGRLIARSMPTSKSVVCSSHGLLARDLRKLDGTLKNQLPAILVRPRGILINFDFIKAIIKSDSVILVESAGDPIERIAQSAFLVELQGKLQALSKSRQVGQQQQHHESKKDKHTKQASQSSLHPPSATQQSAPLPPPPLSLPSSSPIPLSFISSSRQSHGNRHEPTGFSIDGENALPFELIVLETILMKVCGQLQETLEALVPQIDHSLSGLERFIHWDKLQILLSCKRSVNSFHKRIEGLRHSVAEVLNSDADMAAMYLSEKDMVSNQKEALVRREDSDHEEVELLLESYLKIIEEVAARVEELSRNMESTEDIVNIGLIGQRNELLLLELRLSIGTFAAAIGSLGASFFGMNLHSGLEAHPSAFYVTALTLSSIAFMSFLTAWKRMTRLVRKN